MNPYLKPCANCGAPTPYVLAGPGFLESCCGRIRCEQAVRTGTSPAPSQRGERQPTIAERELRDLLTDALRTNECASRCGACWVCRGEAWFARLGAA